MSNKRKLRGKARPNKSKRGKRVSPSGAMMVGGTGALKTIASQMTKHRTDLVARHGLDQMITKRSEHNV